MVYNQRSAHAAVRGKSHCLPSKKSCVPFMTPFNLSEQTLAILHSQGWREGREIDIAEQMALLRSKNVDVSATAAGFLREFSGLRLLLPNGGLSAVNFDVGEEMKFLEEGELAHLESLVGQSLCPVGLGGRFLLFIAPSGELVFLHDEWLLYLHTRNAHDAFEVICIPGFNDYDTVMLSEDQKPAAFRDTS